MVIDRTWSLTGHWDMVIDRTLDMVIDRTWSLTGHWDMVIDRTLGHGHRQDTGHGHRMDTGTWP